MKPTLHRDGSVSFWSVYNQCWHRTYDMPSDQEFAAMPNEDRRRIALQLAANGCEEAEDWLESEREPKTLSASYAPIDVGFDVRACGTKIALPAGDRLRVRFEENGEVFEVVGTRDQVTNRLVRAGYSLEVEE